NINPVQNQNLNQYRAVFTNEAGSATTTAAVLHVGLPPVFTSVNHTTFAVGAAGSYTVTADGPPAPTFSKTRPLPGGVTPTPAGALPSGVTLSPAGLLSGTPAAGTGAIYALSVIATNSIGTDTQSFTLTVNQAAGFSTAASTTFAAGTAGTFTVTATGFPAPT